ncbi:hypothetical protein OEIGOIKO_02398 [Streptomyces chrestomyceticus JCM 4735]|uniref:Uncharacterized protein n=1 Tax=Streptomyces chrestomyceticus JCM 4735 TaxID=1306181 RepID=A0A7U9PZU7_9ACTN|nr:hypothetical protein [Streptomyces chrestomyceticus]GCD34659.1 hypothetical protein OEIGOIKO_02398 [Streptomyces chrestomyceticus JCM 4735]
MDTTKTEERTDDTKADEAKAATGTTEADGASEAAGAEGKKPSGAAADAGADEQHGADEADGEETADADAAPAATATGSVASGAGSVVAAGLGLASLTGTWVGTVLAERQTLLGQIKLQTGKATDQIGTVYGAPWHTHALVNAIFALLAVVVAGLVLLRPRPTWVRAVAWGGLALGVLGLIVSAGMYFDLFASMPTLPKAGAGTPGS